MRLQEIQKRCIKVIKSHLPGEEWRVWLFGSQARGAATETSDIDLAIVGKKRVTWAAMAAIKAEIREIPTLRSIDVVDVHDADPSFEKNIFANGRRLT